MAFLVLLELSVASLFFLSQIVHNFHLRIRDEQLRRQSVAEASSIVSCMHVCFSRVVRSVA